MYVKRQFTQTHMNLNIQKGLEGVCWFPEPLALILVLV